MSLFFDIEKMFLDEGYNKTHFVDRLLLFSKTDRKGRTMLGIYLTKQVVNFTFELEDPYLDDVDITIGLHLFCKLFKESKNLKSLFKKIKSL